ncbi:MAG: hypothetical protein JST04_09215 [Bdellovibrionales bacterium]|nr:hypothetical protein [Bdellovibrionales bacterium]
MSRFARLALLAAFFLLDTGCQPTVAADGAPRSAARVTADEVATEFGLPSDPGPREVSPAELPDYPLSVDVFRTSESNPAFGAFRSAYVSALVPKSSLPEDARERIAARRFSELSRYEFAVWSRDGKPFRVVLVSTGSSLPDANYRLDVIRRTTRLQAEDGPSVPVSIPFPWLVSETRPDDPMTWGLWIFGGYFLQSTPFYADLGLPAVDGGVHQSLPDAMELYRLAQETPTVLRLHAAGSAEAAARLRELAPIEWTLERLDESRVQIAEVINLLGPEIRTAGHGWVDPTTGDFTAPDWPKCDVFDCFKSWDVAKPEATGD